MPALHDRLCSPLDLAPELAPAVAGGGGESPVATRGSPVGSVHFATLGLCGFYRSDWRFNFAIPVKSSSLFA